MMCNNVSVIFKKGQPRSFGQDDRSIKLGRKEYKKVVFNRESTLILKTA